MYILIACAWTLVATHQSWLKWGCINSCGCQHLSILERDFIYLSKWMLYKWMLTLLKWLIECYTPYQWMHSHIQSFVIHSTVYIPVNKASECKHMLEVYICLFSTIIIQVFDHVKMLNIINFEQCRKDLEMYIEDSTSLVSIRNTLGCESAMYLPCTPNVPTDLKQLLNLFKHAHTR